MGESSVRDPDLVESLHDFLIDDEDDGNVHTHAAQARNGAFVEPVGNQGQESVTTLELWHNVHVLCTRNVCRQ